MRQRKSERSAKRQKGQFLTPKCLARDIVRTLDLDRVTRILEPSSGDGSFVLALLDTLMDSRSSSRGTTADKPSVKLVGIEIDETLHRASMSQLPAERRLQEYGIRCDLLRGDFFRLFKNRKRVMGADNGPSVLGESFDLIVGNPPFGGTFDPSIEDALDGLLGNRLGIKIKKETYAFFIVACTELLRPGGKLLFICSDSLLTIPTMTGLRNFLMHSGTVSLHKLREFSDETSYPMLVLEYTHGCGSGDITCFGDNIARMDIEATPNLSWGITADIAKVFRGRDLGGLLVASSGMTTGKNEFFVRELSPEHTIREPYYFRFYDAPITVEDELKRARLHRLSPRRIAALSDAVERGDTERHVSVELRATPLVVRIPRSDYRPYNKANGEIVYSPATHVIYWKDDGDAVLTYKRRGNWYLRGVGGQPFFGREGLTWQLIASRFAPRYLPSGYILDSGAPCAFLRNGTPRSELFFIIGWLLSPYANYILKTVINHTRNIQSKDFERMPYPWWVSSSAKTRAVETVTELIGAAKSGRRWKRTDREIVELGAIYDFRDAASDETVMGSTKNERPCLGKGSHQSLFGWDGAARETACPGGKERAGKGANP